MRLFGSRIREAIRIIRGRAYMAMQTESGNAIDVFIRSEEDAIEWLEHVRQIEPEALDVVVIIEFDRRGHALRSFTMSEDGKVHVKTFPRT